MYPANGWMLVSRDFGTPNEANAYPFLLLYNKFRGILRVCILRTYDVLSSYQQITLGYASNISYPKFFKYSSTKPPYAWLNEYPSNPVITESSDYKQTAVTYAGVQQWMIADFDLTGYSESFADNTSFNISVSEIAQSDVVLNGSIQLDGEAQPQAAGGPNALSQIKYVESFYTKTAEGVAKVLKLSENDALGRITGGSSTFLNGILGLITGFSGGNQGVPYNLKLKGTVNQSGSIKLTSPKTSFSVYLKPITGSIAYRAVQNIPWGVFYLETSNAIVGMYNHTTWVTDEYGYPSEVYDGFSRDVKFNPNFFANSLMINPAIINDVASVETWGANTGGGFAPVSVFDQTERSIWTAKNEYPLQLGVKITFNNGDIVYKLFSF